MSLHARTTAALATITSVALAIVATATVGLAITTTPAHAAPTVLPAAACKATQRPMIVKITRTIAPGQVIVYYARQCR